MSRQRLSAIQERLSNGRLWPITVACKRHGLPESHADAIGSTRPQADSGVQKDPPCASRSSRCEMLRACFTRTAQSRFHFAHVDGCARNLQAAVPVVDSVNGARACVRDLRSAQIQNQSPRNTRLALTPPKPKPLEIAYSVDILRGDPPTMSMPSAAESGSVKLSVGGAS